MKRAASALLLLLCARPRLALDVYPAPGALTPPSADYSATVGPSALPAFVYFTSRAAMQPVAPNNNIPQMSGRNTSFFGFAMDADADGPVTVVVTVESSTLLTSAQILPLSAAAAMSPPVVSGRTVTLRVDQPRQFCVVVNGVTDAPLCVFADPPETYTPSPTDPGVIFFAAGTTTDAGVINVSSGQTVYLAPGAHVFGRVQLVSDSSACSQAGRGVAVRGRGVLDGHRFTIDGVGPSLVQLPCSHALLEGITMIDSPKYHYDGGWPYTVVRWAKAVSWAFSTDGVDLGSQGLLENSFLKVNDDSIKPFGPGGLAQRVVIWQQENGCAVMGSWNLNQPSGFITVRNIDVIRHERIFGGYYPDALLCFMHGGSGVLSNYLFDDIRVDSPGFALVNFFITPNPWANPTGGVIGNVSTVIVRNVFSALAFLAPQSVLLEGNSTLSGVRSVTFDNVTIAGRPAGPGDVGVIGSSAFVDAPFFCVNCTASIVGTDWTAAQKCSLPDSWCSSRAASTAPAAASLDV